VSTTPPSGTEPLYAYLDTNALLEFRSPRDLDWNALLQEQHVILVITPVVTEELQRIKDGAARDVPRRKRQRAGDLLKTLEQTLFPNDTQNPEIVPIKTGVALHFDDRAVSQSIFANNSLDATLADARLVAAVIAGRDAQRRVCLVSNDAGSRWQAKNRGIRALDLPNDWRVKDELDPTEVELRDAKRKLLAFESRAPRLALKATSGASFLRHELPKPRGPLVEQVDGHMQMLRQSYSHYGEDLSARLGGLARGLVLGAPGQHEIDRYNQDIDAFLAEAERVLPDIIAFQNERDLYLPLRNLAVTNQGTQPAEEVRVVLSAPSGVAMTTAPPTDGRPRFPAPPPRPRSYLEQVRDLGTGTSLNRLPRYDFQESLSLEPTWEHEDDKAAISIGTVRHHDQRMLPTIWFKAESYEKASGFSLVCELHAYNLPTPVADRFDVQLVKGAHMSRLDLERWNHAEDENN
jgi:hypothetical protein